MAITRIIYYTIKRQHVAIFVTYYYIIIIKSKSLLLLLVPPLNDGPQHGTQFGSSGDDLQAFIDEFDLMISNQDVIQF